jgi:hypothetical protein
MTNYGKSTIKALRASEAGAKKNCFFCIAGLPILLLSGIFVNVKSTDYNSLNTKTVLPDNPGELRSREARTDSVDRHSSPGLSGFFMRLHRRVGVL